MKYGAKRSSNRAATVLLWCMCWFLLATGGFSEDLLPLVTRAEETRHPSFADPSYEASLSLNGIITLADTNRSLLVLEDATGALALHLDRMIAAQPGTQVHLKAARATGVLLNFPDYPYRQAGFSIQPAFQGLTNSGHYRLTRMRGYLRPPETGEYRFWIASDNSSELRLSVDEQPLNARRIASVSQGLWVNPLEWSRYPEQSSEPILLYAGRNYYIETLHEQLEQDEHLAVAWEGPGVTQSIIGPAHLRSWGSNEMNAIGPPGLLREYWTNYALGNLSPVTAQRRVHFGLSASNVTVLPLEVGAWPEPRTIQINEPLAPENNYRWVTTEGILSFMAREGATVTLEIQAGSAVAVVKVPSWEGELPDVSVPLQVRVQGVCEGAQNAQGQLVPGILWAQTRANVTFSPVSRAETALTMQYSATPTNTAPGLGGFFVVRGVITFNGRVFDKDCLFVQQGDSGVFVSQENRLLSTFLRVGQAVEMGGSLLPSQHAPRFLPMIVNGAGEHVMPEPLRPNSAEVALRDSRWTEINGIGRRISTNGLLHVNYGAATLPVWIGQTSVAERSRFVNAKLRLRGVTSLDVFDQPLLLVPSPGFIELIDAPPVDVPRTTLDLLAQASPLELSHQISVSGVVTYSDGDQLFVQDPTGAARVKAPRATPKVGTVIDIIGFAAHDSGGPVLEDALISDKGTTGVVTPRELALDDTSAELPNQKLTRLRARLVERRTTSERDVLGLQLGPRMLQASLKRSSGPIAPLTTGSLLEVTGICLMENYSSSPGTPPEDHFYSLGAMHMLLRSPGDVVVVEGPPWWNWKKGAVLIAVLLALLTAAAVRVHLMRLRYEKQQAERLAFARQLIQNQEAERRRIAGNLHDTLGQNLLAIKNQAHLALQTTSDPSALRQRLSDISETTQQALEEVRQLTHDLRPYQLDRLGLTQALRAMIRRVSEDSAIEFASWVDEIDGLLSPESETHVYRIVQEATNNVVKHSKATESTVVLKSDVDSLKISVRDNGRGLEAEAEGLPTGFGLSGIRERVQILGGDVQVIAPAGEGFDLRIRIPISPRAHAS